MNDELDQFGPVEKVDEDMKPLDQLKKYQFILRKVIPLLDAYEATALMQIVDRTIGWKKHEALFEGQSMYAGDKLYGGISRSMHRSRMLKALTSMEERNLISRRRAYRDDPRKVYRVNFDVDLVELERSAKPKSKSAKRRNRAPEWSPQETQ
jgi:hypothetical protein